jgi:hypothetical protein
MLKIKDIFFISFILVSIIILNLYLLNEAFSVGYIQILYLITSLIPTFFLFGFFSFFVNPRLFKFFILNFFRIPSILILLMTIILFLEGLQNINNNELVEIEIIQSNLPEIIKSKGGGSININSKDYPQFIFKISGCYFENMFFADYNENVKIGDSLKIVINKSDYDKKILKVVPLTFIDKHLGYNIIEVYSLRKDLNIFLPHDEYCKNKFNIDIVKLLFLSIIAFLLFFVQLIINKKS